MGLFKSKDRAARSLWRYFLPVFLISITLLIVVTFLANKQVKDLKTSRAESAVKSIVSSTALQVSSHLTEKFKLLNLIASSNRVVSTLRSNDDDAIALIVKGAERLLPGVIQLRFFDKKNIEPDPLGVAPFGYAGVDLVKRALSGRLPDAEIHQISAGKPYIAMALAVRSNTKVEGVLFAAWPLDGLHKIFKETPPLPGVIKLIQGDFVIAANSQEKMQEVSGEDYIVESIWKIAYTIELKGSLGTSFVLNMLVLGGVPLLLFGVFLQHRLLTRDLKQDMSALVNLAESIAGGNGDTSKTATTIAAENAVLLLKDILRKEQKTHAFKATEKAKNSIENKAKATAASVTSPVATIKVKKVANEVDTHKRQINPEMVPLEVFRAYDIRGIVDETLTHGFADLLGKAFAKKVKAAGFSKIVVAHDARLSSPQYFAALNEGLRSQGVHLVVLGEVSIALLYYAMHSLKNAAGVMLTGSHNPVAYNGFKLFIDGKPVHGGSLQSLRESMLHDEFLIEQGTNEDGDFQSKYIAEITQQISVVTPLKAIVDGGNGVAGPVTCALLKSLGVEVKPLFCKPDGRFPNHHPDPGDPDNMAVLALQVQENDADIGLAFDGDGDRLGVVDNQGNIVSPEHILMLLASDILQRYPGSDVVYDVKSSRNIASYILAQGGRPIMWQSGHTRIKDKMRETGALIGGEYSGHYFIKDRWNGMDDATYVAARLLEIIAVEARPFTEILAKLPVSVSTYQYQVDLEEGQASDLIKVIAAHAKSEDARVVDLDGLRIEYRNGWGLVRASNTIPALTFRFEADDESALDEVKERFKTLLKTAKLNFSLPF